jgi:hypothetical protein
MVGTRVSISDFLLSNLSLLTGGLLELGTNGLYERKVAVPDTRFRLYNAYSRIGRSGLSMAFPFSTNYRYSTFHSS